MSPHVSARRTRWFWGSAAIVALATAACGGPAANSVDGGAAGTDAAVVGTDVGLDAGEGVDAAVAAPPDVGVGPGPADAAAVADAGDTADAQVGPVCLPSRLSGTWTGDAHATADCGPFVFEAVDITGDLIVDPGVEIRFEGRAKVAGALRVGAGARLLCVVGAATYGDFVTVATTSQVQGTAAAPVVFGRTEVTGFNNSCTLHLGVADVDYATFASTPVFFGEDSTAHDSIFDPSGNAGDRTWLTVGRRTVLEHCRFSQAQVRGRGFTARYNHFNEVGYDTSIEVCELCGNGADSCTGTRTEDAAMVVTGNVFDTDPDRSVFSIGRTFGEVSMPDNYFSRGRPTSPDAWSGGTSGCSDGLGVYGGPLVLTPAASAAPAGYGPRP